MVSDKWTKVEILNAYILKIDNLVEQGEFSSRQSAVNYIIKRYFEDKKESDIKFWLDYLEPLVDEIVKKRKKET